MKILAQVNATPTILLWDEAKVLMLLEFTAIDPNAPHLQPSVMEFVADVKSLTRLGNDLIKMAQDLEEKATSKGFDASNPTTAPEVEVEDVDETAEIIPFRGSQDN